jgi:hypothetical protein
MASGADPWAERAAFSLPMYLQVEPTRQFFVPYTRDPAEAEAFWLRLAAGRADARRAYSLTHRHGDLQVEATVGRARKVFGRKKDRWGRGIPSLDTGRRGHAEGSVVTAIVDRGDVIEVWSLAMTRWWPNPDTVYPDDVLSLEYFRPRGP